MGVEGGGGEEGALKKGKKLMRKTSQKVKDEELVR